MKQLYTKQHGIPTNEKIKVTAYIVVANSHHMVKNGKRYKMVVTISLFALVEYPNYLIFLVLSFFAILINQ